MDVRIEQALFGVPSPAHSPGFRPEWLAEAGRLHARFGVAEEALYAMPLRGGVAVTRVSGARARVLAVPAELYRALEGDLFAIDGAFPPDWAAAPALEWKTGALPPRTASTLARVLDTTADRTAAMLGAAQALLDGGRVVFERHRPDEELLRGLWMILPSSSRSEMWPATYAPDNVLGFHVLATPQVGGSQFAGYLRETEVMEYPDGSYELSLQTAVEAGDEPEVARLLARSSRPWMVRLALVLLVIVTLAAILSRAPQWVSKEPPTPAEKE